MNAKADVLTEIQKEKNETEFRSRIAFRNIFGKYPNRVWRSFVWSGEDILFYDRATDTFYLAVQCPKCGMLAFAEDVVISSLDQIDSHRAELDFRHPCPDTTGGNAE